MDSRLQRLQALAPNRRPAAARRQRIVAEVLYVHQRKPSEQERKPNEQERKPDREKEAATLRAQMKALALQKRAEKEAKLEQELVVGPVCDEATGESESSSEESDPQPLLKPVFIGREERGSARVPEEEDLKSEQERAAHELLVDFVRREYTIQQQRAAETVEGMLGVPDPALVDDTDGLNEEEELEAWRLRELLRFKRDREEREKWEREKIELERIRNMTEEERRQLDEQKQKEWEAQPKSQMKFMQKYYHKGAFFMDSEEPIYQRDYAQATGVDANANKEVLPQVLQVRDYGKKGRSKWTHLVGEDTTAFDYGWGQRSNNVNYALISKMGGMRGNLDNPAKRAKKE